MNEPVTLHATFTARTGEEDRVARLLDEYSKIVHQEPGNILFEPSHLRGAPGHFFVYEEYRDEAAFQAHLSHPAGLAFNAELTPLIAEPTSELTFLHRLP